MYFDRILKYLIWIYHKCWSQGRWNQTDGVHQAIERLITRRKQQFQCKNKTRNKYENLFIFYLYMYFWPIKIRQICTNFCGCFWSDIAAFIIIIIIKIVTLIIGTKVLLCYYRLRIVFYPLCAVVQFLFLSHNYGFYHFNPLDLWNGISLVCLTLSNTEYVNLILLHKNEWYY